MEWKEVTASEFCTRVTDGTHDSPKQKEDGYYLITSKHLQDHGIDFSKAYKISEDDYLKVIARSKVEQYDILFSMIGTIGNIYRVTIPSVDFAVKNMGIFKMGGDETKSLWLYYWLKSPNAYEYIHSTLAGSTQSYLTLKTLRDFPVKYPEYKYMQKIVSILSSLDSKIETNNKINAKLEEMAQALFKSWFVDFEPFKDKGMVESELGMIPVGWRVGKLGEITAQQTTKVKDREDVKVLSPVTTGELLLSEEYFCKQVYSTSIAKYKVVKMGNFAYNPARVNIGSLGRNEFNFDGCVSPVYIVFSTHEGYEFFFDLFRKRESFKKSVESLAIGGVRQSLNYDDFAGIECVIPPKESIVDFNKVYREIKKQVQTNKEENFRLTNLRDTLLPKLMSGEIEV